MDEDDLLGSQETLRNGQRSNRIVSDDAAGVADHVCIALFETEHARRIEPSIHTSDNRDLLGRRHRQVALREARGVRRVVGEEFVGYRHGRPPSR